MAIADKMRKLAGIFVEMPESEPGTPASTSLPTDEIDRRLAQMDAQLSGSRSVVEVVRQSEGPNLDQIALTDAPAPAEDGALDFDAIFAAADLPPCAFSAEQTLELLAKLPANLPLDVKRATLQATLATLGATVGASAETIVADAARKLAALDAYAREIDGRTDALVALAESEIVELTQQIESKRAAILAARQRQQSTRAHCDTKADQLDDVLEFFSLDTGASRYADSATPPPLPPQSA